MDTLVENGPTSSELASLIQAIRNLAAQSALPSERALADKLSVKRHQLRRALHVLRTSGEIGPAEAKRNGHGIRNGESLVRDTNPLEVIEMRIAIEPFLARLAALRASPIEMARIERAATTPTSTESGAADLKFHKTIAASSGNNLAASLYALLRQVGSDSRVRAYRPQPACPKRIQQRDSEHRAIALAILARDGDAAEQAMRLHLAAVQQRVIEQLNPLAVAI
jgi:GntR family transcriptional repressor for pyruvate dehydrogenase complex